MKLPVLFPVVFFGGGILLSISVAGYPYADFHPRVSLLAAAIALLGGWIFFRRAWLRSSLIFAAVAWLLLGATAAKLEALSAPTNLASALIESGKLDSSVALRWRGRLQADPLQLPWGTRYQIALEQAESSSGPMLVSGGLRLTLYRDDSRGAIPPQTRAGDSVEVLARAPGERFWRSG